MPAPDPLVLPPAATPPGEAADPRAAAAPPRRGREAPGGPDPATGAEDAKWRFLTCAALTVPILYLSPPVQGFLGLEVADRLPWAPHLLLGLTTAIFLYGGWPFVAGAWHEVARARPGRMTLVAVAVTGAFAYAATVTGREAAPYFWEAAALVDVALLGHWAEMRSRVGGGRVRGAQAPRTRAEGRADRVAAGLTLVALVGGALTLAGWLLLSARGTAFAVERALAVVAVAAPHVLPLGVSLAAAVAARMGTQAGRLVVTDVLTPPDADADDVLALAAAVERGSGHPLAAGILRSAQTRGLPIPPSSDVETLPGRGARAVVGGREVRVLSPSAVREAGVRAPFEAVAPLEAEGRTVVWLVDGGRVAGALALAERPALHPPASRRVRPLVRWTLGYHAVALPLAAGALAGAGVVVPPAAGAALASLASVGVALGARRLRLDPG